MSEAESVDHAVDLARIGQAERELTTELHHGTGGHHDRFGHAKFGEPGTEVAVRVDLAEVSGA